MSEPRQPPAVYHELLYAMIFCLCLGLYTLLRGQKQKEDFHSVTGAITSLSKSLDAEGHLNLNNAPIRYLQIHGQPRYFRLYIGEDLDGSKPDFQRVDDLKIGDVITIYYDETIWSSTSNLVSNLAYFIDKDNKSYFKRGGLNKPTYYYLMGAYVFVIVVSFALKKAGKIS
jgi:hypothetical protein